MDGTLLNEKIEMTPRAAEAIFRAQEAGLDFAIATGRTIGSGYTIIQEQGITSPFIELNGARLFDREGNIQFTRAIQKDETKELINIIENYGIHNEFITQDVTYSNQTLADYIQAFKAVFQSINPSLSDEAAIEVIKSRLSTLNVQTVDDYSFLYQNTDIQVLKTLLNADKNLSILKEIQHTVEENLPGLIVTSASTNNIEINNKHANKGQAVAEYATSQGYKPSEVITIGDNINDLTMLEWADHSYAVSNAHQRAKEVATYQAPSHTEDAVAQIIERVLDGKSLRF